jgi:hypothetical protein
MPEYAAHISAGGTAMAVASTVQTCGIGALRTGRWAARRRARARVCGVRSVLKLMM